MEDNLCLVELLLDLHDAVGLLRVLVLCEVLLELGHDEGGCAAGPAGSGVLGEELVDDLAKELMRHEGRVLVVRDDDAADALGAAVGVEGVVCKIARERLKDLCGRGLCTLLLDILSLAGTGALGDGLCEKGHELAIAGGDWVSWALCVGTLETGTRN